MMLLDTQALLWWRLGDPRLGQQARGAIQNAWESDEVALSAISFWEIAMLWDKGRIRFPGDVGLWRQEQLNQGLVEIPVDGAIAVRAGTLTDFHGDPADRLVVATAMEGHQLVTSDARILAWSGNIDRLNARE